jgi:hypothetical protein
MPSAAAATTRPAAGRMEAAMLLLSCAAFGLLAWAFLSRASALAWGLALAAWAVHDAVGFFCRRRARAGEVAAPEAPLSRLPRET